MSDPFELKLFTVGLEDLVDEYRDKLTELEMILALEVQTARLQQRERTNNR